MDSWCRGILIASHVFYISLIVLLHMPEPTTARFLVFLINGFSFGRILGYTYLYFRGNNDD